MAQLSQVRKLMSDLSLAALIVPSSDHHNSEYVANAYQYRAMLSNFFGSAGTCVVTHQKALLWTDGRYWQEAEKVLSSEWELMRDRQKGTPTIEQYLKKQLGQGAKVGIDPFCLTMHAWKQMEEYVTLVPTQLIAECTEKVLPPSSEIFPRPAQFCGKTCEEKITILAQQIEEEACDFVVLSALDDIAWLTNLRGNDVPYNPVFYAYAVVTSSGELVLFLKMSRLSDAARSSLPCSAVICEYEDLNEYIKTQNGKRCAVDKYQTSQGVFEMLNNNSILPITTRGFVQFTKAVKNDVELDGFRNCHLRDGCALTRYLAWLDQEIRVHSSTISELEGATKLEDFRRMEANFMQLSFGTISASGANGSVVHYQPTPENCTTIKSDQLYLVDSGAQYWDGTTDVTRTVAFGKSSKEEQEMFTLVLKGHIAIATAVWPPGTTGHRIDVLARTALWNRGLNYSHGTGHGVGTFLNVHEGPQGISTVPSLTGASLDMGMILSNEPGFYRDGHFGIRIENLEVVVPAKTKYAEDFLTFESLTMVPLCRELIDASLLTTQELNWVNDYHQRVRDALLPQLQQHKDERAITYLMKNTESIS